MCCVKPTHYYLVNYLENQLRNWIFFFKGQKKGCFWLIHWIWQLPNKTAQSHGLKQIIKKSNYAIIIGNLGGFLVL